jgi:Ni,Fe-hydrogenase III large subunit
LFSHPTKGLFLFVEHPISARLQHQTYPSICHLFPAAAPFEAQLAVTLGLFARDKQEADRVAMGQWLPGYRRNLYPMRRDRKVATLITQIEQQPPPIEELPSPPPDGEWYLPVGPVHAGIIEPGRFLFRVSGEVIEDLQIQLGYTHKGIEKAFQTLYSLQDGWQLAEHIVGDSVVAHSTAYCQATEALAGVQIPSQAVWLRGLFLELERIVNHIGDCSALVHDVAYDIISQDLAALQEELWQFSEKTTGSRYLRSLNRPGGVILPEPLDTSSLKDKVNSVSRRFSKIAKQLIQSSSFRDRLQWAGILTKRQAEKLGVTGLVARASGIDRDFRRQHPSGIYQEQAIQEILSSQLPAPPDSITAKEATAGDSLARFVTRTVEVGSSTSIIDYLLATKELDCRQREFLVPVKFQPIRNLEFGLGYAEGWRGEVIYWLMQGKFGSIYHCHVRDPSVLNWRGLAAAIRPHILDKAYDKNHKPPFKRAETILPDFPVINKSFNLSYSGYDL